MDENLALLPSARGSFTLRIGGIDENLLGSI